MTDNLDFSHLDLLKATLDSYRPLNSGIVRNLREDMILRWTYHSNAIEGNTLSLLETKVVLEGITIGGKSLREHFETINHREAISYVESIATTQNPISEHELKSIHSLILKNVDEENAGRYRTSDVIISGARNRPPQHFLLMDEMEKFFAWYKGPARILHAVERAACLHLRFVKIHPFIDGNGRTARFLMNLELMKAGFPPAILLVDRRLEYYKALDLAHVEGNEQPFIRLVCEIVEASFEPYWFVLGIDQA